MTRAFVSERSRTTAGVCWFTLLQQCLGATVPRRPTVPLSCGDGPRDELTKRLPPTSVRILLNPLARWGCYDGGLVKVSHQHASEGKLLKPFLLVE